MSQISAYGVKIAASFVLPEHENQLKHFQSLFGSKYIYNHITLCGVEVVDCIKIDPAFKAL